MTTKVFLLLTVLVLLSGNSEAVKIVNGLVCPFLESNLDAALSTFGDCDCDGKWGIFHGLQVDAGCDFDVFGVGMVGANINLNKKTATTTLSLGITVTPGTSADATITVKATQERCFDFNSFVIEEDCEIMLDVDIFGVMTSTKCNSCMTDGVFPLPMITFDCGNVLGGAVDILLGPILGGLLGDIF